MTERAIEPPRSILRGGSMRWGRDAGRRSAIALGILAVVCIATRAATTIHYVEDPDSLHFALSMIDFDVTRLQPHFPGYVVFVGLARALAAMCGSISLGFSLVGAIATWLVVVGTTSLAGAPVTRRRGLLLATLTLGSGMLWIYANRYMPDLLGVALLLLALRDLLERDGSRRVRGMFLAALLAGTRLSYLPFLLPAGVAALRDRRSIVRQLCAFALGIALWAVPLVMATGWDRLVTVALGQTAGHFDDFGGTIRTEPNLALRAARMVEGFWTDGLTGYMQGRTPLAAIAGIGALVAIALALPSIARALRARRWRIVAAGIVVYTVWIYLFQNVIYHTRHLLPIVPFALMAVAVGLDRALQPTQRLRTVRRALVGVALAAFVIVGAHLAWQHRRPSALAQVRTALAESPERLCVVSTALVNDYMRSTGVDARFADVDRPGARDSIAAAARDGARIVSVGDYRSIVARPVVRMRPYYHNPYVNRIWPRIELYRYSREAAP
jgi:hypothetical protein